MLFWILAAALTALVTAALLAPLVRRSAAATPAALHDVEVYRDQLDELERDRAEGLISDTEATQARAEIGRRLLKAAEAEGDQNKDDDGVRPGRRAAIIVVLLAIPAIGLANYLAIGKPGLPAQPLAARLSGDNADIATLVARAEQHLARNPGDGRGWDVLAPVYFRAGRLSDAENAYYNAIRLLGPSLARQNGLGETIVTANDGIITDTARQAFEAAQAIDPNDPQSAFYLAVAMAQEGRPAEAVAALRRLAERSPEEAPWLPMVRAQIENFGGTAADRSTAAEPPVGPAAPPGGPTAADVAAAQSMDAGDRQAMIAGMVDSLDARLREDPNNVEGWKRLLRSYVVLDQPERARDALARGLAAFPADSQNGRALTALAEELGVPRPEVTQ